MSRFQLKTANVDIVSGNEVNSQQERFVNHWNEVYFGEVAASQDLEQARVHWRLFLSDKNELVSCVALTDFLIEVDGQKVKTAAVGGLLTAKNVMGKGYASKLMDITEKFFFNELKLDLGILFCLKDLVPFYHKRGWQHINCTVTLQQKQQITTWPEEVMLLPKSGEEWNVNTIHVPKQ